MPLANATDRGPWTESATPPPTTSPRTWEPAHGRVWIRYPSTLSRPEATTASILPRSATEWRSGWPVS